MAAVCDARRMATGRAVVFADFFFGHFIQGSIKLPILGEIKQWNCMVHLKDFSFVVNCLGWCHIIIPVTYTPVN